MKKLQWVASTILLLAFAACSGSERATPPREGRCITCHEDDRQRAKFPLHTATGFPTDCARCHNQVKWSPASFDHRNFPLTGAHSWASCASCHDNEPVPKSCIGCHDDDRQQARDPDHLAAGFPTSCEDCHNNLSWKPAPFDHSKFPFVGGHADVACASCHPDASAPQKPKGTTCFECHDADRARAKNPDHSASGFPTDCAQCHTVMGWENANFAHDKFRLTGRHSTTPCADCHSQEPVPTTCIGCHDDDRKTPTNPDHLAASFSTRCSDCHSTAAWKPVALDHSKFPLTGGHSGVDCQSCHPDANNPEQPTSTTCIGCHEADRQTSKELDHFLEGFPSDCSDCHTVVRWKPSSFEHLEFPLLGGHQGVACATCHDPEPVPNTCVGCHDADRQTPTNPNHLASDFSTACENCHSISAWKPASFDHSKFPLTAGHSTVACESCHTDAQNPEVPKGTTCAECHAADRSRAVPPAPDHLQSGFPSACENCHTTSSWRGAIIDHSAYPLTGRHTTVACNDCHGRVPLPTTCVGCHDADRQTPTNPDHLASTFSTTCDSCHGTSAWVPAAFDHSKFPLTGAHANVACTTCHTDAQNPDVPKGTTCNDCHAAEARQVVLPNHTVSGFSTDCAACHSTSAWKPATFDHEQYFILNSGPHSKYKECSTCHTDPQDASVFSCFAGCHEHNQTDMDRKHSDENDYSYNSVRCLECHPRGQN